MASGSSWLTRRVLSAHTGWPFHYAPTGPRHAWAMRRALPAFLLLAFVLPAPVHADHGGIHISEILPSPGSGQREFIELWNTGPGIDLTNWTIGDGAATPNVFTFDATMLPTGGRIVVWGGGEDDARGPAWSKATVWNNGGDQAILRDAAGTVVHAMAYGDAAWPGDPNASVPPAPPEGRSLALRDAAWIESAPTPGSVATEQRGDLTATVEDVAPHVAFSAVPGVVEPGATFSVTFSVHDGNGDEDVAAWRLLGDGTLLDNGTVAGTHAVSLGAPVDRDSWHLRLEADDAAGQTGNATVDVLVEAAGLVVAVPPGGILFPAFPPGALEVLSEATFTLRNDGDAAVTPRIDVSDLSGPASIPLEHRLHIGYEAETTTWTTYDGPLTALPPIDPGTVVDVRLRLVDLPTPLPAGSYATSFAVVE